MALTSYSYSYPYIIVFIFLFIFSLPLSPNTNKNLSLRLYEKNKNIAVVVFLIWFIGLRAFVGWDLSVYYPFFNKYLPTISEGISGIERFNKSIIGVQGWEKGFVYFCILIKSIINNYFFYRALTTAIFFLCFYELAKDNTPKYIVMSLSCFYVFEGFDSILINLERFYLAMSIFFLGYKYIKSGDFKKYLLVIIFACFFHIQSIFWIPAYFFVRKKHSKTLLFGMFFLGTVIYILNISFIKNIIEIILNFIPGRLGTLASVYLKSEQYNSSRGIGLGFLERTLTYLLILLFPNKIYKEQRCIIATNFLILCLWCHLFLSEMAILETRFSYTFVIGYWFFYPMLYEKLKKEWKIVFLFLFFSYSCLKLYVSCFPVAFYYENVFFDYTPFEYRNYLLNRIRFINNTPMKKY